MLMSKIFLFTLESRGRKILMRPPVWNLLLFDIVLISLYYGMKKKLEKEGMYVYIYNITCIYRYVYYI